MSGLAASLARIGNDRLLTLDEAQALAIEDPAPLWRVYEKHFQRFTGATLDPQFARLESPAESLGVPELTPGATVVVVGTGPSLADEAHHLQRVRDRVSVWTSLRGAEALAAWGVQPDVIVVQHTSDLDAHLTTRHVRDRNCRSPLASAPIVLAEPRTPAALLSPVAASSLAAIDPATGWGLWPATLVALSIAGGARSVALLGIDLGSDGALDPAHAPLAALLSRIATQAGQVVTVDAGRGAAKIGWLRASLCDVAGVESPCIDLRAEPWPKARRLEALEEGLTDLAELLRAAEEARALAVARRDRRANVTNEEQLSVLWRKLLDHRDDVRVRRAVQEQLGARFLPRFWRQDVVESRGPLWRPVLLATHEIVAQAEAARRRVARAGARPAA